MTATIIKTCSPNRIVARKQTDHDNYETPAWCVASLLARHPEIKGTILEPCCGAGSIVREVKRLQPDAEMCCYELRTDPHMYEHAVTGFDFIARHKETPKAAWCIQNPPFKRAAEMLLAALDRVTHGVALFQRTQWMESIGRYRDIWSCLPLRQVWIFVQRVGCVQEGEIENLKYGGMLCFAWYLFDKQHQGQAQIGWINDAPDFTHDTRRMKQPTLF